MTRQASKRFILNNGMHKITDHYVWSNYFRFLATQASSATRDFLEVYSVTAAVTQIWNVRVTAAFVDER